MEKTEQSEFMVHYLAETWHELTNYLLQHPEKLAAYQLSYWQSYMNLAQEFSHHQNDDTQHDKRFRHHEWQKNVMFHFIQRSYQLLVQHTENLHESLGDKNNKIDQKLRFYSRQLMNSLAPSNFIHTNPEILSMISDTNGANLITGFKQFQEDLIQGKGQLDMRLTDASQFELGKNIACSVGNIIFQNDLMQLIQYDATTEHIYQNPILIIPPWINKYYILDLQKENSFVKYLIDQGYTVFMISWVNPTQKHGSKEFFDYLIEGPLAALDVMKDIIKSKKVNLLGYCVGGTLLGCLLAYFAQKPHHFNIASATFLTTLFDFSEPGELGIFIDEKQITLLEQHMMKKGYLDGKIMAGIFNMLRANDLIWSAFVNNYLKGQKPKPFDLLYWNADSTNLCALAHSFYLRNMYLNNLLIQPNKLTIKDIPLDLGKINVPHYFLAAHDDHIIPWQSSYRSQWFLNKPGKFVLAGSGHVAGVINPPDKHKYGYWTHSVKPKTPEKFLSTATFHPGSWWCDWHAWLKKYAGKLVQHSGAHRGIASHSIEKAPGSYVRMRSSG